MEPTYAPPQTSIPKTFGILSIIFASLGLLGGLLNSCSGLFASAVGSMGSLVPPDRAGQDVKPMFDAMAGVYRGIGIQGAIMTIMSGMLLAIGIGQLRYRRWAQAWSVNWGIMALAALAAMILVALLIIGPAYSRFLEMIAEQARTGKGGELPAGFSSGIGSLIGGGSAFGMALFYAPYPILLIAFFRREKVKAAMTR